MSKNKVNTLLILLISCTCLWSQNYSSLRAHVQGVNVFYPGLEVAYEIPILGLYKTNSVEKTQSYQLLIAPTVEVYHQKINHTGMALSADLIAKWTSPEGFECLVFANGGILQTILAGEVYELNGNASFSNSRIKGNRHFQWKVGFGFGKNLLKHSERPISINMRLSARQQNFPGSPIVSTLSLGVNYFFTKKEKVDEN